MPVQKGFDEIGVFYRWGEKGKKYYVKDYGIQGAQDKALTQGRAIHASRGH